MAELKICETENEEEEEKEDTGCGRTRFRVRQSLTSDFPILSSFPSAGKNEKQRICMASSPTLYHGSCREPCRLPPGKAPDAGPTPLLAYVSGSGGHRGRVRETAAPETAGAMEGGAVSCVGLVAVTWASVGRDRRGPLGAKGHSS